MVLTLKKIQHKGADRIGLFLPWSAGAHHNRGSAHNLRHSDIKTTMIYTHVSNKSINRIQSPLDWLNLTTENKGVAKS